MKSKFKKKKKSKQSKLYLERVKNNGYQGIDTVGQIWDIDRALLHS